MIGSFFLTLPICLWRYVPADFVSGVPSIRHRELIPLLSIEVILPDFFALIVFLNLPSFSFLTLLSKLFFPFCALIISLNFS